MSERPTVLITRPRPDAETLAARLQASGYQPLVVPLLEIHCPADVPEQIESTLDGLIDGILITSRHALSPLASLPSSQDFPLYVVGPATKAAARELGFTNIHCPEPNYPPGAEGLLQYIGDHTHSTEGKWLYLRGQNIRHDLVPALQDSGFIAEAIIAYEAKPATSCPSSLRQALAENRLSAATFFSARTAAIFRQLVEREGLTGFCNNLHALTLSKEVTEALQPLPFAAFHSPEQPDTDHLLALLESVSLPRSAARG